MMTTMTSCIELDEEGLALGICLHIIDVNSYEQSVCPSGLLHLSSLFV